MFTPDALVLGPLVLEWGRLAFLIGVMVFLTVLSKTEDAKLERIGTVAVIVGVLAARLGFVFEQREAFAAGNVLEVFDLRSGGFSWPWALLALVPFAWLRSRAQLSKLASATVISMIAAPYRSCSNLPPTASPSQTTCNYKPWREPQAPGVPSKNLR